jgi:hypothetical protein
MVSLFSPVDLGRLIDEYVYTFLLFKRKTSSFFLRFDYLFDDDDDDESHGSYLTDEHDLTDYDDEIRSWR